MGDAKGRKAEFNVSLEDLKIKELPELNDEFAKQASDKENMSDLRADLEKRLKEDNDRKQAKTRQDSLLDVLVKELEVDLPKSLIDQEVQIIVYSRACEITNGVFKRRSREKAASKICSKCF